MLGFMHAMTGIIEMEMVAQLSARLNQGFNALEEVLTQMIYARKSVETDCYPKTQHTRVMMATSLMGMDVHQGARLNQAGIVRAQMTLEVYAQKYAETVYGWGKSFAMTVMLLMGMDAIRHAILKNAGCAQ
jgi:hypothetical protein